MLIRGFSRKRTIVKNPFVYADPPTPEEKRKIDHEKQIMMEAKRINFDNPIRKMKYHSGALPLADMEDEVIPKELFYKIKKADNPERLLGLYNKHTFHFSSAHIVSLLSQLTIVIPDYIRMKQKLVRQAQKMKKSTAGLKSYNISSDPRISMLLTQLEKGISQLTPGESVKAVWAISKCNKQLDSKILVEKIMKKIVFEELPLVTSKDLGVLLWSMAKIDMRNTKFLGNIGLEFEKRYSTLLEMNEDVFEKIDADGMRLKENDNVMIDDGSQTKKESAQESDEDIEDEVDDYIVPNAGYGTKSFDELRPHSRISVHTVCVYFWSLSKLNLNDTDFTAPLFKRMISEGVIQNLNLLQLQMILPTLVNFDFEGRKSVVEHVYSRLQTLLGIKYNTKESNPFSNSLTIKTVLVQLSLLVKDFPAPENLFQSILIRFCENEKQMSHRFTSEVMWSIYKSNIDSIPPSVCRKIENSIIDQIATMQVRDIVQVLFALGKIIKRRKDGDIHEMGFDVNTLVGLLVNELGLKKERLDTKGKGMLREVKPFLAQHCAMVHSVISS